MDVTSDEIRSSRFQGTRHVYDRREIDAFLHRTAATLEVYERKLAVTQAHIESLEKALDLAHGRARSIRSRETRISDLESALAAAQHNYESALAMLEAQSEAPAVADVEDHELVVAARARVEELLEEAMQEAARNRAESKQMSEEAAAAAALTTVAAQSESEELRKNASLEHAAMLEEVAQARLDAKAALEAELETKRSAALTELEAEKVRLAGDTAAAQASVESRLAKAERKAAKSEQKLRKQLQAAEARAAAAEAEIDRAAAAAEAERKVFTEDAERMFQEAVARAEADRDSTLQQPASAGGGEEAAAETAELRRQVAQLRTALSGVRSRFSEVSDLSVEELELSAMLVGLEVGDGEVIDLTTPAMSENVEDVGTDPNVTVKSRWTDVQPMHAAPRAEVETAAGEDSGGVPAPTVPTWRDAVGATRSDESVGEVDSDDAAVIGFYERRLAGLRARLKDAAPKDG